MNGFWMKTLRVDLSTGNISVESLDEKVLRKFIGGSGIGALYLKSEVKPDSGPLDPGNLLIFSTGPFQASKLPGSAKFSVITRSPVTGGYTDTAAGADFGHALKGSGYDFVIFTGKSEKPVYLYLENGKAELRDARYLWGKDSIETIELLKEQSPGISVSAVGPGGENQVAIANIYVDGYSAAGRGGAGAVMGSKKLKAFAVKGNLTVPVNDPEQLKEIEKKYRKSVALASADFRIGGTVGGLVPGEEVGNLPVKNWQKPHWHKGALKIGLPGYSDMLKPKLHPCKYCPIACHRVSDIDLPSGGHYKGPAPEYESLALLGSSCMIDDLELLVKANDYCNRMGIDTMSAGSCAAFSMEALERGHTNGHKPDYPYGWGTGKGLLCFLEELVEKKGFGGLFSDGIMKGAANFSAEVQEYACHVKGLDVPAHDPRVYYNLALSYATGNRGACHMRAYSQISTMGALLPEVGIDTAPPPDTLENSAFVVKTYQDFTAFYNACVLCQFMIWGGYTLSDMVFSLNIITGWDMTVDEVMEAGDRIFTLQRLLNNQYGLTGKDDKLPERFFQPAEDGARAGKIPEPFQEELLRLYKERGWDQSGIPLTSKIEELGGII